MSKYYPSIPGIENPKRFMVAVREALELGLGNKGQKNSEGRYLDEFITRRTLLDEIVNSGLLASAISYTISVTQGLNDPVDKYIVDDGGVGTITLDGSGLVTVFSETGTSDILDKIAGLSKGQKVYLIAASSHTITLTAGSYLKLPSPVWTLAGYRIATFDCMGSDICVMSTHEANRT